MSTAAKTSSPLQYGLRPSDLAVMREAICAVPGITEVVLFGSRAKGTYKNGSDVDLAIKGDVLTYDSALALADLLNEEKPLPYYFDVLHYASISEPKLLDHIDRIGVVVYQKDVSSD